MDDCLIITTFNEGDTIENLLKDIIGQTKMPTEVIIVDAGSTDSTIETIKNYQSALHKRNIALNLFISRGANIAQGRNLGIKKSNAKIIAVTDAGCRLDKNWYKNIIAPLEKDEADLVGGFFIPIANSKFQKVVAALTTANSPPKNFIPSSRSISFKKTIWEKVGGYPEWLKWGEDTKFDIMCLQNGAKYVIEKDAFVYWEVRKNFSEIFKQYFRYAFGDGLALRLSVSHFVPIVTYIGIIIITIRGYYLIGFLLLFLSPIPLILKKIKKLWKLNLFLTWIILSEIHISRAIGYLYGLLKKPFLLVDKNI